MPADHWEHMPTSGRKVCFDKSKYIIYQPYAGLHVIYHVKRLVFSGRSDCQKIEIIDNDAYGRMLFLDNNVQHTSYDSRIFNEALCGVAKKRRLARVVILGGGSGQTVLSLLESASIEQITVLEIDPLVVRSCRKHIKGVDQAFRNPKVKLIIGDAFRNLHAMNEEFDATIVDLTERPFWSRSNLTTLKRLYADIKAKCNGRCSQYVGSSVGLAYNPRLRSLTDTVSRRFLSNVSYEDVFIPSFGAPHTFMHAGYEKRSAGRVRS